MAKDMVVEVSHNYKVLGQEVVEQVVWVEILLLVIKPAMVDPVSIIRQCSVGHTVTVGGSRQVEVVG
jgi:hypothetical protein